MTQEEKDRAERRKSKSYTDWLKYGTLSSQNEAGDLPETQTDEASMYRGLVPVASGTTPPSRHSKTHNRVKERLDKPPHSENKIRLNRPDNNGSAMSRPSGLSKPSHAHRNVTERLLAEGAAASTSRVGDQHNDRSKPHISTWDRITAGMQKNSS